jgi:LPXTG-site transpeptidase (sortase) family protein
MASDSDTLNIGSIRLHKEYPMADIQARRPLDPVIHPDAAAAARARIAALPEAMPFVTPEKVPAAPTADLVTDKHTLAHQYHDTPVSRPKIPSALRPMLTAVGIFAITLLLFKSPVILSQLGYSLGNKPTPTQSTAPSAVIPAANTITISKINVSAPVVYEPSIAEASVQRALQDGVVHYGNTAVPGQNGNVAIFGHSSNDWWEPGNYKFVFVLLDKLVVGDRLTMDYQSRRYTYEVTSSKVVEPTEVGVLAPTTVPTLTLITCSPPGTSLRRLVVTAKQVDPDPSGAVAVTASPSASGEANLPSSAPSFFTQVKDAWKGVVSGFKSLFGTDSSPTTPSPSPTPLNGQIPTVK